MSDTPQTDAEQSPAETGAADDYSPMMVGAELARTLERQRDQAHIQIKALEAKLRRRKQRYEDARKRTTTPESHQKFSLKARATRECINDVTNLRSKLGI